MGKFLKVSRQSVSKLAALALLAVVMVAGASGALAEPPLIPDTGVDVGDYVTAGITAMAAVVAICVGGFFAFLIVKVALRWARGALKG